MSRKQKEDYDAVFQHLREKLQTYVVEGFIVDFEKGAWQSIRHNFPGVPIKGCAFHWNQAVWRHVQEYGLVTTYRQHAAMYKYIRQLMAIPFLPPAHIIDAFHTLKARANSPALTQLVNYMQRQWFDNPTYPVESWCVFQQVIRTNNDVEGWHNRLNMKSACTGVGIYKLIPRLRREAELVATSISAEDLDREVNRRQVTLQQRLEDTWSKYLENQITTAHFLKSVGNLYSVDDQ